VRWKGSGSITSTKWLTCNRQVFPFHQGENERGRDDAGETRKQANKRAGYNQRSETNRMNTIVVQNAIGELQKVLGKARDALTQIEAERHGYPEYLPHIGYEYPEDALASHLDELQEMLMIVLEAAEMRGRARGLVWRH
jgi:hypothetical protein